MSIIKNEYSCKVITTCYFEQNNRIIEIKCGDYNYLSIFAKVYITH